MKATTGSTFLWCCFDITLCEVVLTLVSVDEILKFDHSNESYIYSRTLHSGIAIKVQKVFTGCGFGLGDKTTA